ncbi:MAG: hypothetical protein HQL93_02990 [Magnetococcales bacterium]|nr:hypothetical protein [Magnetococcales bacterium]
MRLQNRNFSVGTEGRVVRFIPLPEFKQEASEWMNTMTDHLHTLEQKGVDSKLTDYVANSMDIFHRKAALRGLNDIADLALHVARALERTPNQNEVAKRVVFLSLAAVSQIQWLLNPSVEGAGKNAQRIVGGLLQQW